MSKKTNKIKKPSPELIEIINTKKLIKRAFVSTFTLSLGFFILQNHKVIYEEINGLLKQFTK